MEKRRYREELTGATRSSDGSPARPPPQRNDTSQAPLREPFHQRLDRYGRPFGDRIILPAARGQPLRNKLIPPPVGTNRRKELSPHHDQQPQMQWRGKQQHTPAPRPAEDQSSNPSTHLNTRLHDATNRPPLERNLANYDFAQPPFLPTRNEVLAELQTVSDQYINVTDPAESAARKQRVMQCEKDGLMEETAAGIIAAASANLSRETEVIPSPPSVFNRLEFPDNTPPPPPRQEEISSPEIR
ncbi:hypothetical protein Bca4012_004975 [Brassica carinata]